MTRFTAAAAVATVVTTALAQYVTFTGPAANEGVGPDDLRLSRDGNYAVASASNGLNSIAYRVERATGHKLDLGGLNATVNSYALCINADGTVVGGDSYIGTGATINRMGCAFVLAGGSVTSRTNMGDLPGGVALARALAVNDAGTFFAGYGSVAGSLHACSWTFNPGTGAFNGPIDFSTLLPPDANANRRSRFLGMNGTGTILCGNYTRTDGQTGPFVRDSSGAVAVATLPDPANVNAGGEALAISQDGSTIVGYSGTSAVYWKKVAGVWTGTVLTSGTANGVSADGSVIVGDGVNNDAFVWSATQGIRFLGTLFANAGYNLQGRSISRACDVSADGTVVAGYATIIETPDIGFIATIPNTCPADLGIQGGIPGQDGLLDNNDFVVFINFFFAADPRADVGIQGGVPGTDNQFDNNDFVVYINQFFAGC